MAPTATLVSLVNESQIPANNSDGTEMGNATSLQGFFGVSPIAQPAGYGTITDASGGAAAATNGILTLTGSYNSTIIANALATIAAQSNALEAKLVALGLLSV